MRPTALPDSAADADSAADTGSAADGTGRPARDPFLDNAKFLLIVLVVIGHSWPMGLVEGSRTVKAGYLWISSFHMPAFILLSGYFSRGFTGRPPRSCAGWWPGCWCRTSSSRCSTPRWRPPPGGSRSG
ncbi:acyltransferase family protein [Streptomyces sp. GKU 257-1]|nr:acyltransferase family protein [Streptomyces sp. GKU 257-1]